MKLYISIGENKVERENQRLSAELDTLRMLLERYGHRSDAYWRVLVRHNLHDEGTKEYTKS